MTRDATETRTKKSVELYYFNTRPQLTAEHCKKHAAIIKITGIKVLLAIVVVIVSVSITYIGNILLSCRACVGLPITDRPRPPVRIFSL